MKGWQIPRYFGKHEKTYPADGAIGYQYCYAINGNGLYPVLTRPLPVRLEKPTWDQSPQVKFWMDEKKPTLPARIRRMFK